MHLTWVVVCLGASSSLPLTTYCEITYLRAHEISLFSIYLLFFFVSIKICAVQEFSATMCISCTCICVRTYILVKSTKISVHEKISVLQNSVCLAKMNIFKDAPLNHILLYLSSITDYQKHQLINIFVYECKSSVIRHHGLRISII